MPELTKEQLTKQLDTLRKRAEHLEGSIAELEDDASEADINFFRDELRKTEAKIDAVQGKITSVDALAAAAQLREASEQQSDLLKVWREAVAERRTHTLPDALRERCLAAVEREGRLALERKAYAPAE